MADAADWMKVAGQMAAAGLPGLGSLLGGLAGSAIMPGIGTAGGTAVGGALGRAMAEAVGAKLGVPADPVAIAQAVQANPGDASVRLAEVEAQAQQALAELQDVANARQMLVALEQAHSASGKAPAILSGVALIGFFGVVGVLFFIRQEIPASVLSLLSLVVGAQVAGYGQVLNFWFGSTRGSQKKDAQIAGILTGAAAPPTQPNGMSVSLSATSAGRR